MVAPAQPLPELGKRRYVRFTRNRSSGEVARSTGIRAGKVARLRQNGCRAPIPRKGPPGALRGMARAATATTSVRVVVGSLRRRDLPTPAPTAARRSAPGVGRRPGAAAVATTDPRPVLRGVGSAYALRCAGNKRRVTGDKVVTAFVTDRRRPGHAVTRDARSGRGARRCLQGASRGLHRCYDGAARPATSTASGSSDPVAARSRSCDQVLSRDLPATRPRPHPRARSGVVLIMTICMCDHIEKVAAAAPPLTDKQRDILGPIFRSARVSPTQPQAPSRPKVSPCASAPASREACDKWSR
jgi:hypothetical protein